MQSCQQTKKRLSKAATPRCPVQEKQKKCKIFIKWEYRQEFTTSFIEQSAKDNDRNQLFQGLKKLKILGFGSKKQKVAWPIDGIDFSYSTQGQSPKRWKK